MNIDEYSLWLEPEGGVAQRLKDCIDDFAVRAGTVAFFPHLTLIGGISPEISDVENKIHSLIEKQQSFFARCTGSGRSNDFYRSLFLTYTGEGLITLNTEAQSLFNKSFEYKPHVSLFYGEVPPPLKREFENELHGDMKKFDFEVTGVSLWQAKGPHTDWKKLESFPFRGYKKE